MNEFQNNFFRYELCPYNHTTCQHYQNEIIKCHSQGITFSQEFLNKYYSFLTSNRN